MVSDSDFINSLDPEELDGLYEDESDQRADELNFSVDVSDSYQNLNDLNLLLGGLDDSLSESLSKFKDQLSEYFEAPWAKEIIKLYGSKDPIDANTIRLALENTSLTPTQIEIAAQHFEKTYKQLGAKSLALVKSKFQKILNTLKFNWTVNNFSDPEKIIARLSAKGAIELGDGLEEFKDLIHEKNLLDISNEELNFLKTDGIKTGLDWLDQQFVCKGLPKSSTLALISGSPGVGKSMCLINFTASFLKQGYTVVYWCLADLGPADFICRLISSFYNVSLNSVIENTDIYMPRFKHDYGDLLNRFHALFASPGTLTMSQIRSYMKKKGWLNRNTIFICDYDELLLGEKDDVKNGNGTMYERFKGMYQIASAMTRGEPGFEGGYEGVAVGIMAAQPKTEYFPSPNIPMVGACMGSATKAHVCDVILTIGREQCVNHQGYLNLCKVRRFGRPNQVGYTLSYSGKINVVNPATYSALKESTEPMTGAVEIENHNRIMEETKKMLLTNFKEQVDFNDV